MPGKRVQIDGASWHALFQLAKDRTQDFQELADETFANLHAPWKLDRPADKQHPATIDYNIVRLHHNVVQFGIFAVAMA
jgi:hypothetical protein